MLREKMESHKMLNLKSKEGRKGMEFKKKKKKTRAMNGKQIQTPWPIWGLEECESRGNYRVPMFKKKVSKNHCVREKMISDVCLLMLSRFKMSNSLEN